MDKKILIVLVLLLISSFAFADLRDRIRNDRDIIGGGTGIIRIYPVERIDATINQDTQQFLIDNGVGDYNKGEITCDNKYCFMRVWSNDNFNFFVKTAKQFRSPKCMQNLFDTNRLFCSGYEWLDKSEERLGIELDNLADRELEKYIVDIQNPVEVTSVSTIRGRQEVNIIAEVIGGGGGIIGGIIDGVRHLVGLP